MALSQSNSHVFQSGDLVTSSKLNGVKTVQTDTKANNDNFTGNPGQLTFDTTGGKLRVHDGTTKGGAEVGTGGGSVTTTELADGSVTTAKLANGAVSSAKLNLTSLEVKNAVSGGIATVEVGGADMAFVDIKTPDTDDYDLRLIHQGAGALDSQHRSRTRVESSDSLGFVAGAVPSTSTPGTEHLTIHKDGYIGHGTPAGSPYWLNSHAPSASNGAIANFSNSNPNSSSAIFVRNTSPTGNQGIVQIMARNVSNQETISCDINMNKANDFLQFSFNQGQNNAVRLVDGNNSGTSAVPAQDGCAFTAQADNVMTLGTASNKWANVFATTSTIGTSDVTLKQDIEELSEAEKRVAQSIKGLIKKYRWKDAVEEKGDDARIHIGAIAQEVEEAFKAEGLNADRYGMFCRDTYWVGTEEIGLDGKKQPVTSKVEKEGYTKETRLSLRYEELLAFVISAL